MTELEGKAAQPGESSVAQGKRKQTSSPIPTITVYFPRGLRRRLAKYTESNLLIGWCYRAEHSNNQLIIVVAGLVSDQIRIRLGIEYSHEGNIGGNEASIIGQCDWQLHEQSFCASFSSTNLSVSTWLDIQLPRFQISTKQSRIQKYPLIAHIRAPVKCEFAEQCALNMILYSIPRAERMKYFSLEPIVLPTASSAGILDKGREALEPFKDRNLQRRLEDLVRLDPFRFREITSEYLPNRGPGQGFRRAVELLNQCGYLNDIISSNSTQTANGHHKKSSSNATNLAFAVAQVVKLNCVSARSLMNFTVRGVALIDLSASARQLDLRLGQAIIWPSLGYQIRSQRRKDREPVSNLAPRYIALYNGVWLVMNDVILGQTAGVWICDNSATISGFVSRHLSPLLANGLIDTLSWLDNWPAGLKLNTQLSRFFRDMFVGLTAAWTEVVLSFISQDATLLASLIYGVGLSTRILGLTMLLSIIVDLLQLCTLHWTIFYRIQQAIFAFFCSSIVSLFHLFRGKKRNPLRKNRIDQATYELDQLLLGTIFFTLFVFLWLTVAVYYLQFGILRLGLVGIITLLQTGLAFLNHLPLFALMLRMKESDRLPGGVELKSLHDDSEGKHLLCSYYELKNTPMSIGAIFHGYNDHLQAILNLPGLLWSLLIGQRL